MYRRGERSDSGTRQCNGPEWLDQLQGQKLRDYVTKGAVSALCVGRVPR